MTDAKCHSCGKTLEVYHADEGTCSYVPCECQLERDLEAAKRLPATLQADWLGTNHYELQDCTAPESYWWLDVQDVFDSVDPKYPDNWSANEDGKRLGYVLDAACAAPRLAEAYQKAQAEVERLRECAERVSHAWKFIDPDNIKIMSDAVTALDDALHPLL